MSPSTDSASLTSKQGKRLALAVIGAPRSAATYVAAHWSAVAAQVLFFATLSYWISSPLIRIAVILASLPIVLKILRPLQSPSVQVRRLPDRGVLVSGRFEQRAIPMHEAIALRSVAIEGNRLLFSIGNGGENDTISLNGDAFSAVDTRALHDMIKAIQDNNEDAFVSIATTNGLRLRLRPHTTAASSIEPKWLHHIMMIGSLSIIVAAYLLRHYFLQ